MDVSMPQVEGAAVVGEGLPHCSVIVPSYHEVDNLGPLCERIHSAMTGAGLTYEVIIVDDDSADGSEEKVRNISAQGVPVRIIIRKGERGLSSAVIRGFREAKGAVLVCMDADLSHPPEKLPELVTTTREGEADFVIGSRYVTGGTTEQGWGLFRSVNSKVATMFARPFTTARDPMSGFFAITRELFLGADPLNPVGYKIGLELLVKCRCQRVREIPIHFANRTWGKSKLSLLEQWRYIKHIKRLADYRYGWFSHLVQFCFVGLTGMLVDLTMYSLLLWLTAGLAFSLYVSRATAILAAMTSNFCVNRRLTFSYSRCYSPIRQYLRFVATCSVGAAINWSVSVGLVKLVAIFSQHILIGAVAGILAGTATNFLISVHWVFEKPNTVLNQGSLK